MKTIDKQTLKDQEWKFKSRSNNVILMENFFYKIALTPIEYKKYEVIVYGSKHYEQGRLFK